MTTILKTEKIGKEYLQGDEKIIAVKEFELEVKQGELLSIMGKSGSGKSTILKMLGALLKPTWGTVKFMGQDMYELNENALCKLRRTDLGFIFQDFQLIPQLTAYENIVYPLWLDKKKVDKSRLLDICTILGIENKMSRFPNQLSGGEQQRVAIARAVITQPKLLLCDEPTGNLDPVAANQVMRLLYEIQDRLGTAMIIVTHDKEIANQTQRIITI